MGDHAGTIHFGCDDITKNTRLILTRFGSTFGTLRFDEKSFFIIFLGSTTFWDYEFTNAIKAAGSGVNTSKKILNLSKTDKINLKCDCINGTIEDGSGQPILYSFVGDKLAGYKVFCEPETLHYKKNK